MSATGIQWTDVTDNVIVAVDASGERKGWWCRKISPGCLLCYAEALNQSDYFGGNHLKYAGAPPVLRLREDIIDAWARQTKPKKHFVASMTDVFGEWVPESWIFRFLDGMRAAAKQIFQILTKRASNMREKVLAWLKARGLTTVPSNIWLGVTVEDQARADERIPNLLLIPCAVRFISMEPMLERIDLSPWLLQSVCGECGQVGRPVGTHFLRADNYIGVSEWRCSGCRSKVTLARSIEWAILGGESGRKKAVRPMDLQWLAYALRQLIEAGVAPFVKQLGSRPYNTFGVAGQGVQEEQIEITHPKGGDIREFPSPYRIREFPEAKVA